MPVCSSDLNAVYKTHESANNSET